MVLSGEVLFLQGGGAGTHDGEDHRLVGSLRRGLGDGWVVRYPRLPEEADPTAAGWVPAVRGHLATLGDGGAVVAHSVGGTVLLAALAESPPSGRLGAIVLVAAPFAGPGGWQADGMAPPGDLAQRLPAGLPVHVFHGEDDPAVPPAHADLWARTLPQARVHRLPGRDHRLGDDLGEVAAVLAALRHPAPGPANLGDR